MSRHLLNFILKRQAVVKMYLAAEGCLIPLDCRSAQSEWAVKDAAGASSPEEVALTEQEPVLPGAANLILIKVVSNKL